MKKMTGILIIALIIGLLFSCNGHYRFLIGQRPVHPSMIMPLSPGAGYIWIGGEWYFNGNSYLWRDGYWTRPRDGLRWVPGDWKRSHNEWYYKAGAMEKMIVKFYYEKRNFEACFILPVYYWYIL